MSRTRLLLLGVAAICAFHALNPPTPAPTFGDLRLPAIVADATRVDHAVLAAAPQTRSTPVAFEFGVLAAAMVAVARIARTSHRRGRVPAGVVVFERQLRLRGPPGPSSF
jgi:hypothetical protein